MIVYTESKMFWNAKNEDLTHFMYAMYNNDEKYEHEDDTVRGQIGMLERKLRREMRQSEDRIIATINNLNLKK
jgi:hypothetical protein